MGFSTRSAARPLWGKREGGDIGASGVEVPLYRLFAVEGVEPVGASLAG